jgi:hypothetical protein
MFGGGEVKGKGGGTWMVGKKMERKKKKEKEKKWYVGGGEKKKKKKGRGYTTEIEGDGGKKMGKEGIWGVCEKEMNFRGNNKKMNKE